MIKLQFSVITIMFLCTMVSISSTSKDHVVNENKNTQNIEKLLNLNPNQSQYEKSLQDQQDKLEKVNYKLEKVPNQTSKYTNVCWHKTNKKWLAQLSIVHKKERYYGGCFDNEEQAAMQVNLLCDKYGIKRKNPMIDLEPNVTQQVVGRTSKYAGVCWHRDNKKWRVDLKHNGKQYYGGLFDNEEQAAMQVNLLCDKFGKNRKNPTINLEPDVPNQTSKYTDVCWHKTNKKWLAQLMHKKKLYYGGYFDNEEQAAMQVNLLCDKYAIVRKNPTINLELDVIRPVPNQTSQYNGVSWHKDYKKWRAQLRHNTKIYFGGYFDNEEQAATQVNLLCDKYGKERKNPMIIIEPDVPQQVPNQTSKYSGVCWHRDNYKWTTQLMHKKKKYYGGCFDNEEQAAMQVNLLCDKYAIVRKNPTINLDLDVIRPIPSKTSKYTGVCWHRNEKKWQTRLIYNKKCYHGGCFDNKEQAAMKINLLCDKNGIKRKNPMIDLELDAMQKKTKPKINQSKKENVVKTEEESILYGLNDKCENNYIKSRDDSIITESYTSQKRKRKENSIINDDVN